MNRLDQYILKRPDEINPWSSTLKPFKEGATFFLREPLLLLQQQMTHLKNDQWNTKNLIITPSWSEDVLFLSKENVNQVNTKISNEKC